jgi:hypothetical protein
MGEQVAAGLYGGVAQLGEHLPCKQGVMSSNLTISTSMRTALSSVPRIRGTVTALRRIS